MLSKSSPQAAATAGCCMLFCVTASVRMHSLAVDCYIWTVADQPHSVPLKQQLDFQPVLVGCADIGK